MASSRTRTVIMRRLAVTVCLLALSAGITPAQELSPFSAPAGLTPWTVTYLSSVKKHTRFTLVEDEGRTVLRIETEASAGTLFQPVPALQRNASTLQWRWKLPAHYPGTDPRTKRGDDYPVRVYVLFDYDIAKLGMLDRMKLKLARRLYGEHVPAAALCYVWDPRLPTDTILPNAFTDRVRVVVVRSGNADLGQWVPQTRDLQQDFRRAFGEAAPPIKAIAVAGDGDNTEATGIALLGDITLAP